MRRVHLKYYGALPLCNIQKRWGSCDITSTRSYKAVTCKRCKAVATARGFACANQET
jgi:hypothetical protein